MLDATGKKLLRLLQSDQEPALRRAAALVLGELGLRDAEVARAVCAGLDDADPEVRAHLLTAAGKLRLDATLPQLLQRLEEGGPESELAAQAAARLGAKGTKALQQLMHKVAPGLRRRIAGALATAGAGSAGGAGVEALLDKDPGVVEAAARSLSAEVPSLTPAQRTSLADHLVELLQGARKTGLPAVTETAVVRLLAALHDERAESLLWDRIQPSHPLEVRAAALQGLGKSIAGANKERLKRLLTCATDHDFRIAGPALMMLQAVPVTEKQVPEWLALLEAPDVAVRRAAVERLGGFDRPEVAAALLKQLRHPDRGLRNEALARLAKLEAGRQALAQATLEAESGDAAWSLVRSQEAFVRDYDADLRQRLFQQACSYLDAGDRRADALLHLLRVANPAELRDRLEERALGLRKKKQYDKALDCLRLLTRDPACGAPIRLEAAACALKLSPRDLSHEARAADRCLEELARLIQSHEPETLAFLEEAKWLEPEELFYVGFHFAEKERHEKTFGGAVLHLVVERSPRSKIAKDAKSKLRSEGLD